MTVTFFPRLSVFDVEEGLALAPRFPADGLMPCVTTDAADGTVLMLGWMNDQALRLTIETGEAHYFSRTRQAVWHKGATSGLTQTVVGMRIDDDQDCVWLRVDMKGCASCHVGYASCFYRKVPVGEQRAQGTTLEFTEREKKFDPQAVYGDAPNPTQL